MIVTFFNLFTNASLSLLCGLVVVGFFIWLFRVPNGPGKLFLLCLPFVKIIYDFARGLPEDSILLHGLDPFSLPPRHQLLRFGAALSSWGPRLNLTFSVQDLTGKEYASSVGDYLTIWLHRQFGSGIPVTILIFVILVASVLLISRLGSAARFERRRRQDRILDREPAHTLAPRKMGGRHVDVYLSAAFTGTPFTGGVFRPYICVPTDAFQTLRSDELEAVIAHELGHIRQYDLVLTVLIQCLGDLFWFVPGYRWLSRKIDQLREIVADQWAVRSGINPLLLASALIKLKELPVTSEGFAPYSAFFRQRSLLRVRVEALLGQTPVQPARLGWGQWWFRWAMSVWICAAVLTTTLGGNQVTTLPLNPAWLRQLLGE